MTHDKLVEEVAREIYEAWGYAYDGRTYLANGDAYGDWAQAVRGAKRAIALIAERTKEATNDQIKMWMKEVDRWQSFPTPKQAWSAMHRASPLWPTAPAKGGER